MAETKIKEGQKSLLFILILTYFLVVYITRVDPQFLFKLLQNNHSEHQITGDKSVKIKVNSVGDRFATAEIGQQVRQIRLRFYLHR